MSTTDQALLSEVQYALLEPPDGGQNWPSDLWQRDEVLDSLTERQARFLKETLVLVARTTIAVLANTRRVALPTDWVRTVTVVWIGDDGTIRELVRSDEQIADCLQVTWETTAETAPLAYHEYDAPTLTIELAPAASGAGTIDLLYVPTGTAFNGNGTLLALPDEWVPLLKYGLLASLLGKDGRGQDVERAKYCEDRFRLGIEVTRLLMEGWA